MSTTTVLERLNTIELQPVERDQRDSTLSDDGGNFEAGHVVQHLKPVDRGRAAWTVLIAGFVFESLFWGFPMCFGVFQDHYSRLDEFKLARDNIALIGVMASSLCQLGAPLAALLTKRLPRYHRQQIWVGWSMCILGLLGASFTNSVGGLIGTQGVLYGLGFVIFNFPIVSMINEWWVSRKGMAFGLISAASGTTGAFMPFILEFLLSKYGHRTTLRVFSVALVILTGPLLPLFRDRLPASDQAQLAKMDWSFLKKSLFWVYGTTIMIQSLGFFFPVVFLASYGTSVGLPPFQGALLVALMCIAQVLGQFFFGFISDRKPVSVLAGICCALASLASFTLWGLGKSLALLVLFSLAYGFFGFGFGTMRVAMGRAVNDDHSTVFATYSIFVFLNGLGNVLVGPLSTALMSAREEARGGYAAGKYEGVVVMTGTTSVLAAAVLVLWHGYRAVLPRLR